jgi:hypothetical protein
VQIFKHILGIIPLYLSKDRWKDALYYRVKVQIKKNSQEIEIWQAKNNWPIKYVCIPTAGCCWMVTSSYSARKSVFVSLNTFLTCPRWRKHKYALKKVFNNGLLVAGRKGLFNVKTVFLINKYLTSIHQSYCPLYYIF